MKDLDLCTTFPWWNVSRSYPVLTSEPLSKMPPKLIQLHTLQAVMGKVVLVVSVYSCRNHFLALHADNLPAWLLTFFFFFFLMSKGKVYLSRWVIPWLVKCKHFCCLLIVLQGRTHSKPDRRYNVIKSSVYSAYAQNSQWDCVIGCGLLQAFHLAWFMMIGALKAKSAEINSACETAL